MNTKERILSSVTGAIPRLNLGEKFTHRSMSIGLVKTLLCLLIIGATVSCDEDAIDPQKDSKIPPPTEDARPGNIKATMSPAGGSTLTSTTVEFSWDHPGGTYYITLGTTLGGKELYQSSNYFYTKKYAFSNLPSSGIMYFRLFYHYNSVWYYSDYQYTMNAGGSTNAITPAGGSTLTESSTEFTWTHSADYYRIYLGTSEGDDDLYDSGSISAKSHVVKNIPESGKVYLRLWLHINGSWTENFDYTYTANTSGSSGSKNFIITCVDDDLNPSDMDDIADGLKGLGYTQYLKNVNVSSSQLKGYFKEKVKTMYHTGHGHVGYISTSDGGLRASSVSTIAVENLIVATCLTMQDKSWKDKFASTADNVMGYTKISFDYTDNRVAKNLVNKLDNGKSYLQAWYEVNNAESSLDDRWCCYSRSGSRIIEYSAVSGNNPSAAQSSGGFRSLANGRVMVSNAIISNTKSVSAQFTSKYSARTNHKASTVAQDFNTLPACNISEQEAKKRAQNWVSSQGIFKQVEFDKVTGLYADGNLIGHQVRFKRVINSLPVRGNALTDYVSLLVSDSDIATTQYHWSSITSSALKGSTKILSAARAIELSANTLASMYKGEKLEITEAVLCLGYKTTETGFNTLVPAYELISADGASIVVDARSGKVL